MGVTGPKMQRVPRGIFADPTAMSLDEMEVFYASRYRHLLRIMPWEIFCKLSNDCALWHDHSHWAAIGLGTKARDIWKAVYDERTLLRPAAPGPMKNHDLLIGAE